MDEIGRPWVKSEEEPEKPKRTIDRPHYKQVSEGWKQRYEECEAERQRLADKLIAKPKRRRWWEFWR